jgi:hemerythrin
MEQFAWGEHFATGIQSVDDEHQGLVQLLNEFGAKLAEDALDASTVETLFGKLAKYAQSHFEGEEMMMAQAQLDPRHLKEHTQHHRSFLNEVTQLYGQWDQSNPQVLRELYDFLLNWLAYHILGMDKNMARQYQAINSGMQARDAFEALEKEIDAGTEPLLAALSGLFTLVTRRNRQLTELNASLERRVEQRTEELLQANQQLEIIALTDVLTELPNRRHAMRQLHQLWEESAREQTPLSCMMIDADGFKEINDQYGHDAGDEVLRVLARELCHAVRSDDVVCRLGGDEFLIICPNTSLDGARYVAEKTRKKIANLRVPAGDGMWRGSISVGVATIEEWIDGVDALLKAADQSVYLSKEAGKNRVSSIQFSGSSK